MRVLIADDDRSAAQLLAEVVRECGHEVVSMIHQGGFEVVQAYSRLKPDLVVVEFMMPRLNGLTVCRNILSRDPEAKVVLVTGKLPYYYNVAHLADAGAVAILPKHSVCDGVRDLLDQLEGAQAAA